ncbi:MarR family winged helix-turn-helix transcriptional regulator [Listeria costaricensis]|uniref:MarR family winged helix-turn-helix transcriptional regulator n=1 Tax=Listeria costaricensis TaxID=2026604 RepID=UPI000C0765A9|nr:MarR family transcriptional regulator [Listeria costaricensis]
MHEHPEDLGHSVIKAFMNFKRAEVLSFHFEGYTRAEIRFLFMLHHGLRENPNELGVKVANLGPMLHVSKPSVTQQINALEKKGLIKRIQNPEDKRAAYLQFTEKGEKLIASAIEQFHKSFLDMRDYIGEEDMETLIKLLDKLTDYLNNKAQNKEA